MVVLVGTFFEGETVVVAAGALAREHGLDVGLLAACAFAGSFLGDQTWFYVGRAGGPSLLARRPSWAAGAARVEAWTARWGTAFVLGFRFLYGIRTVAPLVLGATRYPAGRFFVLNAVGALLWSLLVTALGYSLGFAVETALGRFVEAEEVLAVVLVAGVAFWLGLRHVRRKRA